MCCVEVIIYMLTFNFVRYGTFYAHDHNELLYIKNLLNEHKINNSNAIKDIKIKGYFNTHHLDIETDSINNALNVINNLLDDGDDDEYFTC